MCIRDRTYAKMNRKQLQWYFYWRARVRQGELPPADIEFVYLYAFELLNQIGVQDADDGMQRLVSLYHNYGRVYGICDRYLFVWILSLIHIFTCQEVVKDERGEIVELRCTYDPETRSGSGFTGRKVKGTIHWVSANAAVRAKVRLYDQLFSYNEETKEYEINANSLAIQENALIEPSILEEPLGSRFQFVRNGYFITDPQESTEDSLVINRIVALKSSYKPVEA